MNRLEQISNQFANSKQFVSPETIEIDGKTYPEIVDNNQSRGTRLDYWNKYGWGYHDSGFELDRKAEGVRIKGNRYMFGGELLPSFLPWVQKNINIDTNIEAKYQEKMDIAAPIVNHQFIEELGTTNISRRSFMNWERVMHSHGASYQEMQELQNGKFKRACDMVVYPGKTEDVEALVKLANKHNVMLVPFGGGTNVTESLQLPSEEKRMITVVDMCRMIAIKWVDKENGMACVEAGIRGEELERELKQYGVCSGHEPDSAEFSTLGGWISTRASGMKKNTYGNIEDIVCNITMITSIGKYQKAQLWPRISNGPDLHHLIMGSEGNYGIITEAVIKVKPLPETRIFDSVLFHDWETGIKFMYAVSRTKAWPTSIRLVDNTQFQFGSTLKPAVGSAWQHFVEEAKKFFVFNIKGYKPDEMAACTLMFEGDKETCEANHKKVMTIAKDFNGMAGGPENGMRGYLLTFLIAYVRNFAMHFEVAAESFETSVPWSNVSSLCTRTKKRIIDEAMKLGYQEDDLWISFRVTQLYETGACVYVYMTMRHAGKRPAIVEEYSIVEDAARDEVMKCGGSLSHHHGIGKLRKKFMTRTQPQMQLDWMNKIKDQLDPNNVFAINNTNPKNAEEAERIARKY